MAIELRRTCHNCDGDGLVENPGPYDDVTCPVCGGSGKLNTVIEADVLTDFLNNLKDHINYIQDKCDDIFEKVNE